MAKLFLGIDWEEDFIRGSLAVPGAEVAERSTANFMINNSKDYAAEAFSEDFHPANHCSFEENGGPWPRHCEAYTIGSAISPLIVDAMHQFDGDVVIITKGEDPDREEYSLFRNEAGEEQFGYLVKTNDITEVDVCGLVREICVMNTIQDLHERFPEIKVNVLISLTPSLDGGETFAKWLEENPWCNIIEF